MIFRIHTPNMETDWHEMKGEISIEQFVEQFQKIDWKKDFWTGWNNGSFNTHSIEAFNIDNKTYFGVSVCPNTSKTFQYYLCRGDHKEVNDSTINRTVKLYGTASDNSETVINYIKLYFNGNMYKLERELTKINFFKEIEDVYWNINDK